MERQTPARACYLLHDLGHALGHAETEPHAQLQWRLDALAAADAVGDERQWPRAIPRCT
jgi:hypothetical protein